MVTAGLNALALVRFGVGRGGGGGLLSLFAMVAVVGVVVWVLSRASSSHATKS